MNIINFFKKIIKIKDNDLSSLNIGDIIWARRWQNDKEKNKIELGHRESPYIVIKKTKRKVYVLLCTSNPHDEVKWEKVYYPIGRLNYDMNKYSFVYCLKVYELKEIQFASIIGHLSAYDLNSLKKQLYILVNSNFKYKPNIENKYLNFKIGIGDVILQGKDKYYIYGINKKEFLAYKLRKHVKKNSSVLINQTYLSLVINEPLKIKIKSNYHLVNFFNTGEVEKISEYIKKEAINEVSIENNTLRVGALIDYKDKMYYVYNENEESIFVYEVYVPDIIKPNIATIQIRNGLYKTYFQTCLFRKAKLKEYKVKRCALLDEIKYNEYMHQLPKVLREREAKKLARKYSMQFTRNNDDFVPMTILKQVNTNKYYLIINRENSVIELVNINNIGDSFYFELTKNVSPFKYYRVLSKEEFDNYLNKINEFKSMVAMFDK